MRVIVILAIAAFTGILGNLTAQTIPPVQQEEEDIRGPKPLIEIPVPEKPNYTLWISAAGGAAVLAAAIAFWMRRQRKKNLASPRQIALESLAALDADRSDLTADQFANQAALTVREYISRKFHIQAPHRSTEEFLRELASDHGSPLNPQSDHLRKFLKSCDLAKFAASHLDSMQRAELIEAARLFINLTATPAAESQPEVNTP